MHNLKLKTTYKAVKDYYSESDRLIRQLGLFHEGAVAPAFARLLNHCAKQFDWILAEQFVHIFVPGPRRG